MIPKHNERCLASLHEVAMKYAHLFPYDDIDDLCSNFNVKVLRTSNHYKDASLVRINNHYQIHIEDIGRNITKYTPFERFLIAHELGHYVIELEFSPNPINNKEHRQWEDLCNYFARILLLPDTYISRKTRNLSANPKSILGLTRVIAREAQVNWETAAYRITDLYPQFAFFKINIDRFISDHPQFVITTSTLPNKKERKRSFSTDNEFGRMLAQLENNTYLDLNQDIFGHHSIIEKFPSLSKLKDGLAYRLSENKILVCSSFK